MLNDLLIDYLWVVEINSSLAQRGINFVKHVSVCVCGGGGGGGGEERGWRSGGAWFRFRPLVFKIFHGFAGAGVAGEGVLRPQTQLYSYIVRFYSFKLDT